MSFIFAHNDRNEIERAQRVLSELGHWYLYHVTDLPETFDPRNPDAANAALWKARLASVAFNGRYSGPVVTIASSLRVHAFRGNPGPAFPLLFQMFSPEQIVLFLEEKTSKEHQCSLDAGLAYVDDRHEDPDRRKLLLERRILGRIVDAAQMRAFGGARTMFDIFVPEGEQVPFSRLPEERKFFYAEHLEELYRDFVEKYEEQIVERPVAVVALASPPKSDSLTIVLDDGNDEERNWQEARASVDVPVEVEWEGNSQVEDTLTLDHTMLQLDLAAVPPPIPIATAVPSEGAVMASQATVIGLPTIVDPRTAPESTIDLPQ